jgi:hypothetical protein
MHTCLGAARAAPRVPVSRAETTAAALASQAVEHYELPCGAPRPRARPRPEA